ncbi:MULTISPECIES: hypothetical protein [unclassified Streptomyces]|uniref:hypothetical protein n=1 Tax=unclassified Streptomyces TaxID=2593676 RepID=UPI0007089FBF|nr:MULTISPECIES: hypothetical protein [unclassified Streptomyces]KRD18841.1 hypothetical protein ASE41_18810 [Streptomyces sp. Root264]
MESVSMIFAGMVFALFGGGLLVWTAVRVGQRQPVAHGVSPVASAALALLASCAALAVGVWCLARL